MADISAKLVKDLRDKTGAGMMDCKKALVEAGGDLNTAIEVLRKSGIAKAEKRSGRAVNEGKIGSKVSGNTAAMVEILCETDFVAKNEKFINYVDSVMDKTLSLGDDGDVTAKLQDVEKDSLVSMIATIGENMEIRRAVRWESSGKMGTYIHMDGKIGVLVDVEGDCSEEFLKDLCMHIAAFNPQYTDPGVIPAEVIDKEKEIVSAQMDGNKPPEIMEKIVMGKLNKWYTEVCLSNQPWIKDDKSSLKKVSPDIKVKRFLRWERGEDI